MSWDYRKYGSALDRIRQSDLSSFTSSYGCSKRFWFRKTAEADGTAPDRERASWKPTHGSAIHALIARAIAPAAWAKLQKHGEHAVRSSALFERMRQIYVEELPAAADGLPIEWGNEDRDALRDQACIMTRELLLDLLEIMERPIAIEAPFEVELDPMKGKRPYHLRGTIDLVYEPKGRPGEVDFCDWKSGQMRMHEVVLAHGYQVAMYAHAVEHGRLFPGTPEERVLGVFPGEIHIVHLRDYLPYAKRTTFTLDRFEEVAWARRFAAEQGVLEAVGGEERIVRGARVEVEPSTTPPPKTKKDGSPYKRPKRSNPPLMTLKLDRRGPAWYSAPRTPADVARLRVSLETIVGTVRLGRFVESIAEQCTRCPFKGPCLTDGHQVGRDDMRDVNKSLRGVEGLDELLDYAS